MNASTRSELASVRSRLGGNAAEMGQGVQPQPPNRLAPQARTIRAGGAVSRGAATAKQPAPAGDREMGGIAPAPSEARLPPSDSRNARVPSEAGQVQASSLEPKAKTNGAQSEPGDAASDGGSRACAAPPEHAAGGRWRPKAVKARQSGHAGRPAPRPLGNRP